MVINIRLILVCKSTMMDRNFSRLPAAGRTLGTWRCKIVHVHKMKMMRQLYRISIVPRVVADLTKFVPAGGIVQLGVKPVAWTLAA